MTRAAMRHLAAPLYAMILTAATAGQVFAQAVITGRVVNEQGAPLVGANVFVQGSSIGSQTNANGMYTVNVPESRVDNNRAILVARYIGYTPQERAINMTPGTQTQNFTLRADPFKLDEVVVTGVAEATSQRKLTFSVSRVSEEQLREVPASSPVAALSGKVAGARVALGSGNPGAPPTIRLRGSTNLGIGNSSPLIIVDGVVTRNNISDIDAQDIESIEVLKGAAAASFYGSDAANGVIAITTKRGRNLADNDISFVFRTEYGQAGVERFVPLLEHHPYAVNADGSIAVSGATCVNNTDAGCSRIVKSNSFADNPFPTAGPNAWRNQLKEWLTDGTFYSQNAQLGLRRGTTNISTSLTNDRNQGILPMTSGQFRQNVRMNVDQGIGGKADVSAGVTYGINRNDYDPVGAGSWFELLQRPTSTCVARRRRAAWTSSRRSRTRSRRTRARTRSTRWRTRTTTSAASASSGTSRVATARWSGSASRARTAPTA
jgi:TonB-dependent SusC/RagA subfamily outer membrane receptor